MLLLRQEELEAGDLAANLTLLQRYPPVDPAPLLALAHQIEILEEQEPAECGDACGNGKEWFLSPGTTSTEAAAGEGTRMFSTSSAAAIARAHGTVKSVFNRIFDGSSKKYFSRRGGGTSSFSSS
mmetsp:Transcript_1831/g.2915  ORF Transcript_1831/g.2915 Transcript_1831/m.2915 type:complete len:125 (+) Transcript_1831:419-793(+)